MPRAVHYPHVALRGRIACMTKTHERRQRLLKRGIVGWGSVLPALVLLLGVSVLGYGFFQQSGTAIITGIVVVVAGCLSLAIQRVLAHDSAGSVRSAVRHARSKQ